MTYIHPIDIFPGVIYLDFTNATDDTLISNPEQGVHYEVQQDGPGWVALTRNYPRIDCNGASFIGEGFYDTKDAAIRACSEHYMNRRTAITRHVPISLIIEATIMLDELLSDKERRGMATALHRKTHEGLAAWLNAQPQKWIDEAKEGR